MADSELTRNKNRRGTTIADSETLKAGDSKMTSNENLKNVSFPNNSFILTLNPLSKFLWPHGLAGASVQNSPMPKS